MQHSSRAAIDRFGTDFSRLHEDLKDLVSKAGDEILFRDTAGESRRSMMPHSVGTFAIRSAAAVEQMINGITVRLWDDPFEWTLPEQLSTVRQLKAYFDEVEAARIRGFKFLNGDADLAKQIPTPVALRTLDQILSETLDRSRELLSQAHLILSEFDRLS